VAVRVLSPEIASLPDKAGEFLENARAEAQLIHPHLVILYEAGRADRVNFCAMEYMDGPPLREFLRAGDEVDEHLLLQTVIGVARALDFLWQQQVPHQPPLDKNVLTAADGTVKLTNIAPIEATASQSQHEDLLKLGLLVASTANDIAPVSKPVGKFVERMLGSSGRATFSSLAEAANAAEALDRKLFTTTAQPGPVKETSKPRRTKSMWVLLVGLSTLLVAAALGWLWWRSSSR